MFRFDFVSFLCKFGSVKFQEKSMTLINPSLCNAHLMWDTEQGQGADVWNTSPQILTARYIFQDVYFISESIRSIMRWSNTGLSYGVHQEKHISTSLSCNDRCLYRIRFKKKKLFFCIQPIQSMFIQEWAFLDNCDTLCNDAVLQKSNLTKTSEMKLSKAYSSAWSRKAKT